MQYVRLSANTWLIVDVFSKRCNQTKQLRQIYLLTKRGTLLRVDMRSQTAERCMLSHYAPMFGIAVANRTTEIFATTGEDRLLYFWNADSHQVIRRTLLPSPGRSCDFAPDDSTIAVGMKNGAVAVYNTADLSKVGSVPIRRRDGCAVGLIGL